MNKYKKELLKKKWFIFLSQIFVFIFIFVLWELLVNLKILDVFLFSKPSEVFALLGNYIEDRTIFVHIGISLYETILGLIIGSTIGFIIASLLWYYPLLYKILEPLLFVLNALPKTALAPIFIIWVGTNTKGIVFVAISISLIISVISLLNYFNNSSLEQQRMLESFGANRYQIFRYLIFPANILNIISTIKINVGMCFIGVIVGEFIVSKAGLGYLIMYGSQIFRLDLVMMSVVILAVTSVMLNCFASFIEKMIKKGKYE